MSNTSSSNKISIGIMLAIIATFIWSGNFIVARGVINEIPPISIAFFRWLCATVLLFPFVIKSVIKEWKAIKKSFFYLSGISFFGIALFNTFVYIGGHYSTAINLALIGTTSSPIMSIILARIFLKEKVNGMKVGGIILCISGILFLLSKGSFQNLLNFQFSKDDMWILVAAFCFAIYNTMAKNKPTGISPPNFLFIIFLMGTLMLLPFYFWEASQSPSVLWNSKLVYIILYLGLGASVICFLLWNSAIARLGSGRTALFGNLIPIFSTLEAVIILNETFTKTHIISMILVFSGILLANFQQKVKSN